jgi:assimilatory nitrate reductase catalytic subunit
MHAPAQTRSTCPYCGVGCGVIIESQGHQITGVKGDPDHPANFGRLCTKGATLHLTASAAVTLQTRLLQPMQRFHREDAAKPVSWNAALNFASEGFTQIIREHGPDSVGFYVSGQLLTEDYYVFNKLAKGLIGTNNIDTNSRLCMSSAVAGYKQTLGADAPPACYDDINHAQCIFIAGSNTAFAHPILFRRIEDAKKANPNLRIVVVDPRTTDTAGIADVHLAIQPGTDVMLFNGMLHIMAWEGWLDQAFIASHTNGFEDLKATVRDYTPFAVAEACGITKDALLKATRLFAGMQHMNGSARTPTLSLYCQGLNQSSSGTAKNAALINLHLATGQIGKPGAGPFSLTGQPNAMGGREVGGLANLLSAHRDLANPAHRAEVAALWGVPSVPEKPGKTAVEMFQAAADGEIKALWIACTNPAQSMPDQATVRRALERAEFVVVQEAFATTATCRYADLLLPATTWGEKDGTVTNSERRISRVRAAVAAPGEARHDWQIAVDFAHRLEALGVGPGKPIFTYTSPEQIWNEHRESTRGRDLDITGLSYGALEAVPTQWPCPAKPAPGGWVAEGSAQVKEEPGKRAGDTEQNVPPPNQLPPGKARLYEDGIFPTADGRAKFANTVYQPVAEPREARYPFSLNTGRLRDQWHGMSRTGTLGRLFGHVAEPCIEMNRQDMVRQGLADGDLVHVTSKRGSIVVPVQASAALALRQTFMAMHWGEEFLSGCSSTGERLSGVNALTNPAYCPTSKQPEFKNAAVKVLKAELPWSLLGAAWLPDDTTLLARESFKALMAVFPFASCVPFGRERSGLLFRAAGYETPPDQVLASIETLFGLSGTDVLRYADKKRGQRRAVQMLPANAAGDRHLNAFVLAGDTSAQSWIKTLLQDELPAQSYGRMLLAPSTKPPLAVQSRGKQICTCFNVTDSAIATQLGHCKGSEEQRLVQLQASLQCGTNCGSCLPEVKNLVRLSIPAGQRDATLSA